MVGIPSACAGIEIKPRVEDGVYALCQNATVGEGGNRISDLMDYVDRGYQ